MNAKEKKIESFSFYTQLFESALKKDIKTFGESSNLVKALEYSLTNGGKRLRPILVYLVADALGFGYNVDKLALSVEYFHTASLIADDMPCMDNDDSRRNKPSLHVVFGETTALLSSYALISAAFEKIFQGAQAFSNYSPLYEKVCTIALKEASFESGLHGAAGGQFLDLFVKKPSVSLLEDIIEKKTITLFRISFVFGWIFGGGDLSKLDLVKHCAYNFGMAFQIADDIRDFFQDKEKKHVANMALLLGVDKALSRVESHLNCFEKSLSQLSLQSELFQKIIEKVLNHARL